MNKSSSIYIAGHQGFIGSALLKELRNRGYRNLLFRSQAQLDLSNQRSAENFFWRSRPEYVFALEAKTGGISANNSYPADFIYRNIMIQANIVHCAHKYRAKKLLLLGSSCMYPKHCPQPMKPDYLLSAPLEPTNEPFAVAKLCGLKLCQSYNRQYGTNFIFVIPATAYGPGDHFDGNSHVVGSLLARFYAAKNTPNKGCGVEIWGSGKPKREFIYIDDLAQAMILVMLKHNGSRVMNIGSGREISIAGLAQKIKRVVDFHGRLIYRRDKPDGMPRRLLDSGVIGRLGWRPRICLDDGLELTYKWYKRHIKNTNKGALTL